MGKRRRKTRTTARAARSWADFLPAEKLTILALLGLAIWAIVQLVSNYPSSFFPRFSDEGIYAIDVRDPSWLFQPYRGEIVRYAPAKLGYGLPLAASSALFGANGVMYLSTAFWILTVLLLGAAAYRRFGLLTAVASISFLTFSPMFGKYVADVGPTTEAALGFVLLWMACAQRRFWLSGLCVGFIAFVDFKWAVPAALAFMAVELIVERRRPLRNRAVHIALAGLTAMAVIGLAMLIHRPYTEFLYNYVFPHSRLAGLEPSPIFIYYLAIFGALPAVVVAAMAYAAPFGRRHIQGLKHQSQRALWSAVLISGVPILFYSLFGVLKALRFFAVLFPLLTVCVAVGLAALVRLVSEKIKHGPSWRQYAGLALTPLAALLLVHGGSDGPARHLSLPAGYEAAMERLRAQGAQSGTISAYNWPVVAYGWTPSGWASFAYESLLGSDRWIALDPMLDRVTIELRMRLPGKSSNPDSAWAYQASVYRGISDSLFSVPSDFNASDYFLAELVPNGISVLRRWRALRSASGNFLTIRELSPEKMKEHPPASATGELGQ